MHWLNSGGGPLILVAKDDLENWAGVAGSGTQSRTAHAPPAPTDYDRACAVHGYSGLIQVGKGHALVLGDEPLQTTWLFSKKLAGEVLVRWRFAESEEEVLRFLQEVPEELFLPTGLTFRPHSSPLFLFDAAIPGRSVTLEDHVELAISPNSYRVETALYEPNKTLGLVLHRLIPVTTE